jgi:hypothetical protein
MSWGLLFRSAWERATSNGRAAAREAALSPDQAASLLSDAIAHTLQRILYAAQDMQCGNKTDLHEAESPPPATAALRRVMDDIRQGRIAPEGSEKHLQQIGRAAAEQAQAPEAALEDKSSRRQETHLAEQRFADLRGRLNEQLAMEQQRMTTQGSAAKQQRNVEINEILTQTFTKIDDLFLEHKGADDPVAPLPRHSRRVGQKAEMPCLPPRV